MSTEDRLSFDENGVQFGWDATSITCAQTCLRYYYYKIIMGYQPKRKSVHLEFGGVYADALEQFYKHKALGADNEEALRLVVAKAMIDSFGMEFDHSAKTRMNLIRTIVWYIDEFSDESEAHIKTHYLADGKPAVELSFALEVDDSIVVCGHMDRVVEFGNDLYTMDQKTTSATLSSYYSSAFKLDNQFNLYPWVGKAVLKTPVRGMILDAAQIAVGFSRFERTFIPKTQAQLDEWWMSAQYTIDMARAATTLDKFPMNLTACGNYGGCDFKEICSRSPSVRKNFLAGDFHKDLGWDPLKER